jgi:predicted DNA-binding protein/transposase
MVLASADGETSKSIAARLKVSQVTVGKWRSNFLEKRIAGLYDDVRPGRPRSIDDERIAQLIRKTLHTKPTDGATHWSVRSVAAETKISKSSVQRYFQLFGLQPHRTESFKLSTDPFFIEKLRDVVGLYLSPPDNALDHGFLSVAATPSARNAYTSATSSKDAFEMQRPRDLKRRLVKLARTTGRSVSDLINEAIVDHVERMEDLQLAERRLAELRSGKAQAVPLEEVMKLYR